MFNIDRGNGTLLVLLDLSATFDTMSHQILCHILEHSLGITDSALALIKSCLDGRKECVQIEGVILGICLIGLWSATRVSFGTAEILYLYAMIGSIMCHHKIDFHIYADDTQFYVSFDWSNSNIAFDHINLCISDLQIVMIRNKLKINDSQKNYFKF